MRLLVTPNKKKFQERLNLPVLPYIHVIQFVKIIRTIVNTKKSLRSKKKKEDDHNCNI